MRAAFFDLDKTVIAKGSIPAFGRPFLRGGFINRRVVVRAVVGQLIYLHLGAGEGRLERVRETMLALTRGWDRDKVREIVRDTLLETVEPLIYKEALELMDSHHIAGDRVYLVSASPEEIVSPLAELLGADGTIASIADVDEHGRYTGTIAFYASGDAKADAVRDLADRAGIDLSESSAYSDSMTDLPMLGAVGHPVAVNPDRALARLARDEGWETRHFTKPVRLRQRVAARTPVLTTGLALAAGAALLWWRTRRPQAAQHLASVAAGRGHVGARIPRPTGVTIP